MQDDRKPYRDPRGRLPYKQKTAGTIWHPLNPKPGKPRALLVHRIVLYDKIGPGPHPCHVCGVDLEWKHLHLGEGFDTHTLLADHLDGDHHNNVAENLAPVCNTCNVSRGTRAIKDGEEWVLVGTRRLRAVRLACWHCGIEFLRPPSGLKGEGRFCTKKCCAQYWRARKRAA